MVMYSEKSEHEITEAEICICSPNTTGMLMNSKHFWALINASSQRTKMFWISSQHCMKNVYLWFIMQSMDLAAAEIWDLAQNACSTHKSLPSASHKHDTLNIIWIHIVVEVTKLYGQIIILLLSTGKPSGFLIPSLSLCQRTKMESDGL